MKNSNPNSETPCSTLPKRGGWHRLFFWGLLGGGLLFLLMALFLVSITLPNLREVPPPEVSGPHQVVQSQKSSNHSTSPTSGTLAASASTTGTQSFSLDDFPHLSPPMRELTQVWLDRCAETNQALEAIPDPTLRAKASVSLKIRARVQNLLNLPLRWDQRSNEEVRKYLHDWGILGESIPKEELDMARASSPLVPELMYYDSGSESRLEEVKVLSQNHPEFVRALRKELVSTLAIRDRMDYEFTIHKEDWRLATDQCRDPRWLFNRDEFGTLMLERLGRGTIYGYAGRAYDVARKETDENRVRATNSMWNEEAYCWRQRGIRGMIGLGARSYQRALEGELKEQAHTPLHKTLNKVSGWVVGHI
jgi:hypothetical protein